MTKLRAFIFLLAVILPHGSIDGSSGDSTGKKWKVLTTPSAPFVMEDDGAHLSGLAMDLWTRTADQMGIEYDLEVVSVEELYDGLLSGKIDLAIGDIAMTSKRAGQVNFSVPFASGGLGIATKVTDQINWEHMFSGLVSIPVLSTLVVLSVVLLLIGLLIWLFERKRNHEQFTRGFKGIGSGFWWSAVTMSTVGYGDKAPITPGGRMIAALWIFISVLLISAMTGILASGLTVGQLQPIVTGPADLRGASVGAVVDTSAMEYLKKKDIKTTSYKSISRALEGLVEGDVDAVVADYIELRYMFKNDGNSRVMVVPNFFQIQSYAFAAPKGRDLQELNHAMLEQMETEWWERSRFLYLGKY